MHAFHSRLQSFLLLGAGLLFTAVAHAQYTFTTFLFPGATNMQGWAINSALRVPTNASGVGTPADSLIFDLATNTLTPIPSAGGGLSATAIGINDAGVLAGSYTDGSGVKGFILTGTTYDTFSYPGSTATFGRAINNAGMVTGYAELGAGGSTGFLYDNATNTFTAISHPGSVFTIAQGINAAGVVVGSFLLPPGAAYPGSPGGAYGWVRQPGGTITLFRINGQPTRARGINDAGEIAGWFNDTVAGDIKSFVVTVPGAAAYEDIAVPTAEYVALAGAEQTIVEGINNAGYLSGSAYFPDGTSVGFVASPPATLLLEELAALITSFNLHHGTENALLAKVKAAVAAATSGNTKAACGSLQALINQVNALSGKKISPAQAAQIIAAASVIRINLGC